MTLELLSQLTEVHALKELRAAVAVNRSACAKERSLTTERRSHMGLVVLQHGALLLTGGTGHKKLDPMETEPLLSNDKRTFSDCWLSVDEGQTWSSLTLAADWGPRSNMGLALLPGGKAILTGGCDGTDRYADCWLSSDDGRTWTRQTSDAPWGRRSSMSLVVLHKGLPEIPMCMGLSQLPRGIAVLVGGYDGIVARSDCWISRDGGERWTLQTSNAPWGPRSNLGLAVLSNGNLLLVGGRRGETRFDDCWISTDEGRTWTVQITEAPWGCRSHIGLAVVPSGDQLPFLSSRNGVIVMTGGYDGLQKFADCWASRDDGKTWRRQTKEAPWGARFASNLTVLPSGELLLATSTGRTKGCDGIVDCWLSQDEGRTWALQREENWTSSLAGSLDMLWSGTVGK